MMQTEKTYSKSCEIMDVTFCFWKKHKIWSEKVVCVVGIYRRMVVVLFQLKTYFALKYKSELSKNFVSLIVIENQKKKK